MTKDWDNPRSQSYTVDPKRMLPEGSSGTGILVRATLYGNKTGSFDIFELDTPSLKVWLRSRGGDNELAENTVLLLLGHKP